MSSYFTARLTEAREELQLTIEEVAEEVKIEPYYLEAIENGDFSVFPDPLYARRYIRTYARFLEVDPTPILLGLREADSYNQSHANPPESQPSLSRVERSRKNKTGKSPWNLSSLKNKWVILGAVSAVVLFIITALTVWLLLDEDQPVAQSVTPSESPQGSSGDMIPVSENRPILNLVKSSESYEYGDVYEIKNADGVELKITAKKPTEIRVRANGPTGEILADKELTPDKTETFTHENWISLRVNHPQYVTISVNGVIIDTTDQKEVQIYQLKLASAENEQ